MLSSARQSAQCLRQKHAGENALLSQRRLTVGCQNVVPIQATDRRIVREGRVSPVVVVEVDVRWEPPSTFLRVAVAEAVGPLTQQRLDEALGLSISSWRVRPDPDLPDTKISTGSLEQPRDERCSVVGHDPLHDHALLGEPPDRPSQKGAGSLAALICQDLDVSEPCEVVCCT